MRGIKAAVDRVFNKVRAQRVFGRVIQNTVIPAIVKLVIFIHLRPNKSYRYPSESSATSPPNSLIMPTFPATFPTRLSSTL